MDFPTTLYRQYPLSTIRWLDLTPELISSAAIQLRPYIDVDFIPRATAFGAAWHFVCIKLGRLFSFFDTECPVRVSCCSLEQMPIRLWDAETARRAVGIARSRYEFLGFVASHRNLTVGPPTRWAGTFVPLRTHLGMLTIQSGADLGRSLTSCTFSLNRASVSTIFPMFQHRYRRDRPASITARGIHKTPVLLLSCQHIKASQFPSYKCQP